MGKIIYNGIDCGGGSGGGTSIDPNPSEAATDTLEKLGIDGTVYDFEGTTYTAGTNIQINENVISATDTTYSAFQGTDGTEAGSSGLVPPPAAADTNKYLKSDGTWATVSGGGGAGGSSVYSEKVLWEDANGYTSDTNASVTLTDSLLNYDAIVIEVSRESDSNFRNQEFVLVSMIDKTGIKWFPFDMIGSSTDCVATCRYIDETHLILGHWTYIKPVKYYKIVGLKFGTLSPIIYSEEEREVGVWIDGKPLYQKTYKLQSEITVTNTWDWTSLGISAGDIETYVSAVAQNNSGTCWAVNCATINGNISMSTGRNQDTIGVKRFTIQYTKTTDVPGGGKWASTGVPAVHYSENEQVIGTWTDGKPLYQKTIPCGNISGSSATIPLNIENVKYINLVPQGSYFTSSDSTPIPFPYPLPVSQNTVGGFFSISSNTVNFEVRIGSGMVGYVNNLTLTVQYTKTTD